MRATVMGLTAAVLLSAASLAHADPYFGRPPAPTCNPSYYASNGYCWYGPNYCFQGPCLPPAPFNGLLPLPKCLTPTANPPLTPVFVNHPYARSPRDYFMYGQTYND